MAAVDLVALVLPRWQRYAASPVPEDRPYFTMLLTKKATMTLSAAGFVNRDFSYSAMGGWVEDERGALNPPPSPQPNPTQTSSYPIRPWVGELSYGLYCIVWRRAVGVLISSRPYPRFSYSGVGALNYAA